MACRGYRLLILNESSGACRCVNQPQVCKTAAKQVGHGNALSLEVSPAPAEVYSSQASCCRPGLGAFQEGCSFDA